MELVILLVVLGLLFDYTNGFHDAANVVATVIATRALAPLSAIVMAGILNFLGATQISGVAHTISSGLVNSGETSIITILAAVSGAIVWNILTWYYGIPSSSSYALIGGLLGAAWMHEGVHIILWPNILNKVLLPMVVAPFAAFTCSFLLIKALHIYLRKRPVLHGQSTFRHLQIGSACFVALSHGLNDAQKSMGVITLGLFAGEMIPNLHIPFWVIMACAITMALGTASGGFRTIRTMGFSITKIDPIQGFAAETSASLLILLASFLGMPLSSTHMIAGSITGVGAAKGVQAVRWGVPGKLAIAWVLTLPGAGITGAVVYLLAQKMTSI